MNSRNLVSALSLAAVTSAQSAQTYQNSNPLNTWNAADANWDAGVTWTNTTANDAIFGGTGESVAVTTVSARDITISSTGYVLTGSTITLGATSVLTANADATINSGTAGGATTVTKQGTGNLTLGGGNAFTGQLVINAGRMTVNAGGTQNNANNAPGNLAGASSIVINNGGSLDFRGGSTTNQSTGANTIGANAKAITVNTGGTLLATTINSIGYWNQNQYANITMAGGTFTPNASTYINRLTINQTSTVNGTGAIQSWQTSGDFIVANVDATISSGYRINSTSSTVNVAATKTLTISGAVTNHNGGTATAAGTAGFTKSGAGTLVLSGNNVFGGVATVSVGTLKLGSASALGANGIASITSVTSGAVLDLNGQVVGGEPVTLNGSGISSGGALINSSATAARLGGAVTVASASSIGGSGNFTLAGSIGGTAALSKTGTGTVTLSGSSGFTGTTTVEGGTLAVTGSIADSPVTVLDGATLAAPGIEIGGQVGDLTLGTTTGSTLRFPNLSAGGPALLEVLNLQANGVTTISVGGDLTADVFPLITATGRSGSSTFALSAPRGVTANLIDTGNTLSLNVAGIVKTTWKGDAGTEWDIATTQNWKLGATDPDVFQNTDNVLFDGTAIGTDVTLAGPVAPNSVTFNFNDPVAYYISGEGAIAGNTGISKAGSGTVTLANVNTFTGPLKLTGGTLQIGGAGSLGSGNYAAPILNDGTALQYSSSTNQTLSGSISGIGAVIKDSAGSTLTLTGSNNFDGGLTISAGTVSVVNDSNLGTGDITFDNLGTRLTFTGTSTVVNNEIVLPGSGTGTVTLLTPDNSSTVLHGTISGGGADTTLFLQGGIAGSSSGSFVVDGDNTGLQGIMNVQRGSLILGSANAAGSTQILLDSNNNANGALQLSGSFTIPNSVKINFQSQRIGVATGLAAGIDGAITENSANGLEKVGAGTLRLGGINTYTGNTVVTAGTLELANTSRLAFKLGATSGPTNVLSGAGTVVLDGSFAIDTTAAAALSTGTWVLENVPSLTGAYGATFSVVNPDGSPWTDAGDNKWTKPGAVAGTLYTFVETTGTLTLTPGGYDAWLAAFTFPEGADTTRTGDPDHDGFTNLQEFLFGTSPVSAEGALVASDRSGGDFIVRWKERISGSTYAFKSSSTLGNDWVPAAGATLSNDGPVAGDYQPRKATITIGAGNEFFRVEGVEN
ncbi:autotransporter-associated beta strand repeat-containing protein [Luteolibacter arcticus]|uniref:Autotransporter-associated beta strand repeat-containing protein n=1 Tax=Luteolibacter arcticus TaxID=1581411 RepID=A0ABT3GL54_9BACT|nr:autotransporter-associated beta strand repeat-containing protein [Luteolibacter arcticus]MCW1924237.1 autotransporter-associated beta strand repeat-containing protein [Luteolibacter arcticus]